MLINKSDPLCPRSHRNLRRCFCSGSCLLAALCSPPAFYSRVESWTMLSNFIRRNGKCKPGNKAIESRSRQKSFSASPSLPPSLVVDISDESLSMAAQGSPLVELNLLDSNEEWFPPELLRRRSYSSRSSPRRTQNTMMTQNGSTQETHASASPAPSLSRSEDVSSVSVYHILTASSRHLI